MRAIDIVTEKGTVMHPEVVNKVFKFAFGQGEEEKYNINYGRIDTEFTFKRYETNRDDKILEAINMVNSSFLSGKDYYLIRVDKTETDDLYELFKFCAGATNITGNLAHNTIAIDSGIKLPTNHKKKVGEYLTQFSYAVFGRVRFDFAVSSSNTIVISFCPTSKNTTVLPILIRLLKDEACLESAIENKEVPGKFELLSSIADSKEDLIYMLFATFPSVSGKYYSSLGLFDKLPVKEAAGSLSAAVAYYSKRFKEKYGEEIAEVIGKMSSSMEVLRKAH